MVRRIVVAFSGGKDSTAAALLLKEEGWQVTALYMLIGQSEEEKQLARLKLLAGKIGVELKTVDLKTQFTKSVVNYFLSSYQQGLTPNPCIVCNRLIKFNLLRQAALKIDPQSAFATGHYARIVNNEDGIFLAEPLEKKKSQIYFLAMVDRHSLDNVYFPLAGVCLTDVRKLVSGLPLANLKESQNACFLSGQRVKNYLQKSFASLFQPGRIEDRSGKLFGYHQGLFHYTIGQRRGVGLASSERLYVINIDIVNNRLILGKEYELDQKVLLLRWPNYWKRIKKGEKVEVKIRSQSKAEEALVVVADDQWLKVEALNFLRAVTPGQFGVLYQRGAIVAAGEIVNFHENGSD